MTEERITEHTDARGNTHTVHTINSGGHESSAGKWLFLLVLVAALLAGGYFLTQSNASEIARDNAIADAANDVGDSANQVGDAAQDVADNVPGE
ncbi:hypothetical protein [Qipengyuania nanhaisediminis]|uniref:hypothetical protein n=1 Tax=Qipengyuania nanhaisediminis TaxID=604088 RepID=UPI0038B31354